VRGSGRNDKIQEFVTSSGVEGSLFLYNKYICVPALPAFSDILLALIIYYV